MMAFAEQRRLGSVDITLLVIFFVGIYLGVSIPITDRIPFPAAPSGLAGVVLLWRRRDRITVPHVSALFFVVAIYVAAILSATNLEFLGKRFTGLIQLVYSLVISYSLFLTILEADRKQLSRLFFWFLIFIIVGCLLEQYAGLNRISDAVRNQIYSSGVYDADLRDQLLYGKIRPKLFTSEPSAVTFGYTLFLFGWFLASASRWKPLVYIGFLAAGLTVMPGPTLLLSLIILPLYYFFITPLATPPHLRIPGYRAGILIFGSILLAVFLVLGTTIYAERFSQIATGRDPSFFYRVVGPAMVAFEVLKTYPWAGAGLTGEPFLGDLVATTFMKSSMYSAAWGFSKAAEVLTNYFWLHWIYLGLVWGIAALAALSLWLRVIGAPSILFCWGVWVIFGQASGAYVGPKTWVVLLMAAGLSALCCRALAPKVVPLPQTRGPLSPLRLGGRLRQPGLARHF